MDFKLTVDFSPKAEAILTGFLEAMGGATPVATKKTKKEKPEDAGDEEKEITLDDVLAIVTPIAKKGKTNHTAMKGLIKEIGGVDTLTDMDKKYYKKFLAKVAESFD